MHVDNFVAKKFLLDMTNLNNEIQVAVNGIVRSGEIDISGNYMDEWIGFDINGHKYDANFFVDNESTVKCEVYPVVNGETVTNVNLPVSVLLH